MQTYKILILCNSKPKIDKVDYLQTINLQKITDEDVNTNKEPVREKYIRWNEDQRVTYF
jgi:hypothetical protein